MRYHIVTYGCQMNLHESEKAAGMLEARGYVPTDRIEEADLILFNTCCIREGAENRALGNIGAVKKWKAKNPNLITVVLGCMPQQPGKAETLQKKFPFLDIVLGTHNVVTLGEKLDALKERDRICEIISEDASEMDAPVAVRTSGLNAWINISYGCNNFCTYCIVPYVRGREHSRAPDAVIAEARRAIEEGYREITLLGQNVNSYGNDCSDDSVTFPALLRSLGALPGEFRVKYMTSHPKDFNIDVAEAMNSSEKIAKVLHLPVQSGSTRILKEMNRKYTAEEYLQKADLVRRVIPDVGLTTDVMVGFPGETDDDFDATMSLVERVRFDNMFMFVYSRRSGTVADRMPNQVPEDVKKRRIRTLVEAHRRISAEVASECVGKKYRALVEIRDGKTVATTDCGRFVTLKDNALSMHGHFAEVEIIGHRASKLIGRIASD